MSDESLGSSVCLSSSSLGFGEMCTCPLGSSLPNPKPRCSFSIDQGLTINTTNSVLNRAMTTTTLSTSNCLFQANGSGMVECKCSSSHCLPAKRACRSMSASSASRRLNPQSLVTIHPCHHNHYHRHQHRHNHHQGHISQCTNGKSKMSKTQIKLIQSHLNKLPRPIAIRLGQTKLLEDYQDDDVTLKANKLAKESTISNYDQLIGNEIEDGCFGSKNVFLRPTVRSSMHPNQDLRFSWHCPLMNNHSNGVQCPNSDGQIDLKNEPIKLSKQPFFPNTTSNKLDQCENLLNLNSCTGWVILD